MNDKDYYNYKLYNSENNDYIKKEKINYIKDINNKYYKTTNFSDLFRYKKSNDKYGYLSNEESPLVDFLERLMTRNKLSVSQLRQLFTNPSPTGLSLDVKTTQSVKKALDYIERKQSSQYGQNTSISSQSIQPTPSTRQPTQTPSVQLPQGLSFDASKMWSPVSSAGTVYEWNRGVIGISYDGMIEKETLDGTFNHHADATVRVSNLLGANISMIDMPFQAGIAAKEQGILILQSEGDNCLVYFPDDITVSQQTELVKAIAPRSNFTYSFVHKDEIFEDQQAQDVLSYANSFISKLTLQSNLR